MTIIVRAMLIVCLLCAGAGAAESAEQWTEVKSTHFSVISNAGDGNKRNERSQQPTPSEVERRSSSI